jgi:hypothetical protein
LSRMAEIINKERDVFFVEIRNQIYLWLAQQYIEGNNNLKLSHIQNHFNTLISKQVERACDFLVTEGKVCISVHIHIYIYMYICIYAVSIKSKLARLTICMHIYKVKKYLHVHIYKSFCIDTYLCTYVFKKFGEACEFLVNTYIFLYV